MYVEISTARIYDEIIFSQMSVSLYIYLLNCHIYTSLSLTINLIIDILIIQNLIQPQLFIVLFGVPNCK